jgi:hypothetical protein
MGFPSDDGLSGQDSRATANGSTGSNQGGSSLVQAKELLAQVDTQKEGRGHDESVSGKSGKANTSNLLQGNLESIQDDAKTQQASLGKLDSRGKRALGIALVQAILLGKNEVLVSIAHEGEEPHAMIGDLPVTHQWSKTWGAEQLFAEYVTRYISTDVYIGSPLRQHSELRVAELFVEHAWDTFGHRFSSCNRANYRQGADNSELKWCGECPKCANSYLLFAPFVAADELQSLFAGQDLFTKPLLQETFRGLLGIDGVMKPFECVGEIEELRYAYHQSQAKEGYGSVSFDVPTASFDYKQTYPSQDWAQLPR